MFHDRVRETEINGGINYFALNKKRDVWKVELQQ